MSYYTSSKKSSKNAFKICIFGDGGVGKTTLLNRYVTGVFTESTIMTIGVDFKVKKLEIEGVEISLQIWDFAGEDRFRFLLPAYVKGSQGGIFMFDTTRFTSLENIEAWSEVIEKFTDDNEKPLPVVLVGGKIDLEKIRAVPREYGPEICEDKEMFIDYIECSSKTGENVQLIFERLTQEMAKRKGIY